MEEGVARADIASVCPVRQLCSDMRSCLVKRTMKAEESRGSAELRLGLARVDA